MNETGNDALIRAQSVPLSLFVDPFNETHDAAIDQSTEDERYSNAGGERS